MFKPEKSQRERFEETTRKLECDDDKENFNAVLKKIKPTKDAAE